MKDIIIEEKVEKVVTEKTPTSWYQNSVINTREFRESMASFNYVIDGHDVIITSLNCFEEEVVVPMGVTKIGKYAFSSKDFYSRDIESVKLSKTVYEIEEGAFCNNDCIKSIDMESVLKIGKDAFKGCVELEEVGLSACLNEIGANAFDRGSQCEKEMSIVIPNHTKWPKNAFDKKTEVLLWKYPVLIEEKIETYYTDKIESIKQKYKTLKDDIKKGYDEQFTAYKNAVENELKQKLQALKNQKTELERLRKKEEKEQDRARQKEEKELELLREKVEKKTVNLSKIKENAVIIFESEDRLIVYKKMAIEIVGKFEFEELPKKFFALLKKSKTIVFHGELCEWEEDKWKTFKGVKNIVVDNISTMRSINFAPFTYMKTLEIISLNKVKVECACFKNKKYLKEVKIQIKRGGATLEEESFSENHKLTKFDFTCVTRIEKSAFAFCDKLVSPIVSNHITFIDRFAFQGCKKITVIRTLNTDLKIMPNAFDDCKFKKATVHSLPRYRGDIWDENIWNNAKTTNYVQ